MEGMIDNSFALPYSIGAIHYGKEKDTVQFEVPWAARFSIEGQDRIVVERSEGAKGEYAGFYLEGIVLPAMLQSKGYVTLHGSAVVGPRGGLAFIGDKGAGKSTTAAAMTAIGYKILCDDAVPLGPGPQVIPGIPLPKLLSDAYERLIGDPKGALHRFDGVNKYHARLPAGTEAAPLRMIFALEISDRTELIVEPIRGARKIQRVLENTLYLKGLDEPNVIFSRCAAMLGTLPCFRLLRPIGVQSLDAVARKILDLDIQKASEG
jgi:hypothetical protein